MKQFFCISIIALFFSLFSCKTGVDGVVEGNQAPETGTVIDTIIRTGEDRLTSQVEITWWGDDPDGYVIGFEFTFDQPADESSNWQFTDKTDSIFVLAPSPGFDTMDFRFSVRALDQFGKADPTPASVTYPVKNSKPEVRFDTLSTFPIFNFPVVKMAWVGSDADGEGNLKRYELYWNDTTATPFMVEPIVSAATFVASAFNQSISDCEVFTNNSLEALEDEMPGMVMNDSNVLYIRVVDQSEAASNFVASKTIFIKRPVSDILLVNAYENPGSEEDFYAQNMQTLGVFPIDTLKLWAENTSGELIQKAPDNITQSRVFNLFSTIIWFSDDAESSFSLGQKTLGDFFDQGGKLFMSVYVSSSFDEQSNFLDFTPIESLLIPVDTTLFLNDTSMVFANVSGWPDLASSAFIPVVRPINPSPGATILYNAELVASSNLVFSNWAGNSAVMAKKTNSYGETNFIVSTLELDQLDGSGNINSLFQKILIDEFGL